MKPNDVFHKIAHWASQTLGNAKAFILAVCLVIIWAVTGPIFDFSNTWQLFINTGTTILTFLMVFLIQNTQNREARATQLKLDELLRGIKGPRNSFVDLEDLSDEQLTALETEFQKLRAKYSENPQKRDN
ncbi:MAG: low affinity iron permease family protein [bacterium]|nr:low affinity iron permease family protein [bacterium]